MGMSDFPGDHHHSLYITEAEREPQMKDILPPVGSVVVLRHTGLDRVWTMLADVSVYGKNGYFVRPREYVNSPANWKVSACQV